MNLQTAKYTELCFLFKLRRYLEFGTATRSLSAVTVQKTLKSKKRLMAIVGMASADIQRVPDFGHALVEFKNMRFLIMDRPSKANIAHFVQVSQSLDGFFYTVCVPCFTK